MAAASSAAAALAMVWLAAVCCSPWSPCAAASALLRPRLRLADEAVAQLARRLLQKDADRFAFRVEPDSWLPRHRAVVTNTGSNSALIVANSGVAAAWALHHYLTQYCSAMVTWTAAQVALPAGRLPQLPGGQLSLTSRDQFTAMPNVVTFSYSYTWWGLGEWQRHVDWMALHGVNLAYALTGQELVFRRVFAEQFGLSAGQLDAYFPGPAFLAWGRMGNLKGWGGPLPEAWYYKQARLQNQILQMMTSLGMMPVLQGFSGMVPDGFIEKYPTVNYSRLSSWNNFGRNYSEVVLIDPSDPMFMNISMAIINENVKVFGPVTHFYAMDPFNENMPAKGDPEYIRAVSASIYKGFKKADPDGIWVLQSWFLSNAAGFWTSDRAEAFFEPIDKGHLLVINLWGEATDLPQRLAGFYGHNFVWTALHNFGGNNAMYGSLDRLCSHGPFYLRRQFPRNMVGTGIQPEGIGQNEVVYELVLEFNWRSEPPAPLDRWVRDYARRRYGRGDANLLGAWTQLLSAVYSGPPTRMLIPVLVQRPSLTLAEDFNSSNARLAEQAWRQLIATNQTDNVLLNYDQVDLTRQMLQVRFFQYYIALTKAAKKFDVSAIKTAGATLLGLLDSMNELLSTDEHFLLQRSIEAAKSFAAGTAELALYELNVRNQLTCWGPGPKNIEDYAARMYNGLLAGYYRPRWALFLHQLIDAAQQKLPFNEDQFVKDVFAKVELPFYTGNATTGPAIPTGSPYSAVKQVEKSLPPATATVGDFLTFDVKTDDTSDVLWWLSLTNTVL